MPEAHYGVDDGTFIEKWNSSATIAEVKQEMAQFAERTGNEKMSLAALLARASGLRNRGVALKRLKPAAGSPPNVHALNAYIDQIRAQQRDGRNP